MHEGGKGGSREEAGKRFLGRRQANASALDIRPLPAL